jgi:Secretion system C-terminal sorting domain
MKMFLGFFLSTFLLPLLSFGQTATWPFVFSKPVCTNMPGAGSNCTKWPDVQNGEWDNPNTWNNNTLPAHNDIVCIPSGWSVTVKGSTYADATGCPGNTANTPRLFVFVCGTINFDPSGKLYLACASNINVYTGGTLLATNGSSDLIKIGATIVWGGPGSGNQGNVNGPYYLSDGGNGAGVLPALLKDFRAEMKRPFEVTLNWTTLNELNNEFFEVERMSGNKTWTVVGSVSSKGNSSSAVDYSFIDKSPAQGISFYRLKQIDKSGAAEYSSIAKITNRTTGKIAVYPNPASSQATIYSATSFNSSQSIQLFNITGALVKTIGVRAGNTLSIPLEDIGAGVYLVRVTENGTTLSETKLVKQ